MKKAALENTVFFSVFLIKLNYVKFFPEKQCVQAQKKVLELTGKICGALLPCKVKSGGNL